MLYILHVFERLSTDLTGYTRHQGLVCVFCHIMPSKSIAVDGLEVANTAFVQLKKEVKIFVITRGCGSGDFFLVLPVCLSRLLTFERLDLETMFGMVVDLDHFQVKFECQGHCVMVKVILMKCYSF